MCGGAAARAAGDPAAASHFEQGARNYELGHYDEAVASFERAYALDPAPILLFNIAQAHRRRGDAGLALRYYRRYLDAAPAAAPDRRDAERRVRELEQELAHPAAGPGPQANGTTGPAAPASGGKSPVTGQAAAPDAQAASGLGVTAPAPSPAPADVDMASAVRRWRIGVEGEVALSRFRGAEDLKTITSYGGRALGGYRFGTEPTLLEIGGALSVLPISYGRIDSDARSTSTLVAAGARLEVSHLLSARFSLVGEVLAGVSWWLGLGEGNPFTPDGAGASGPIPLVSARAALGVRYDLRPTPVFVYLSPALAFQKPLDEELGRRVSAVVSVDLPVGIGYVF